MSINDFMRDIGVHFNVNNMLAADCYKKRLENGGLTFLEMGYMLMQAFDFVHLNKEFNCKLQIGGSDQWGNILAGVDLSRKIGFSEGVKIDPLFGFVCPLLLKADGEKMGKTASGTLWVSREKTSAFDFFQAWINSFDEDVERSLSFFTRMEMSDIKELCNKDIREAKKLLAFEVTKLVHGEEEAQKAEASAKAAGLNIRVVGNGTVVTADIQYGQTLRLTPGSLECSGDSWRQRRDIYIGVGKLGADQLNTGLSQFIRAVLGAEIGIDDIQVRDADLLSLRCQTQSIVDGNVRLAAAVMPGK